MSTSEKSLIERVAQTSRVLRASRRWSTRDVEAHGGPSAATVCRIESGQHDPTLNSLVKLATAYDVALEHLFWTPTLSKSVAPESEP